MNPVQLAYLAAFGITALVCLVSIRRVRQLRHAEARTGLRWLLAMSGAWGIVHVGYLLSPTTGLAEGFYLIGLLIGVATVGPWLYFCSAYTGRTMHLEPAYRRAAVAVYVVIAVIKLTNPWHEQYYTATATTTPFPHLEMTHEPLHWIVMALAYALSFVGFFMLLELLARVNHDTKPLLAILALTGAPVVLDIGGALTPRLIDTTHSSIGVAFFAVGTLYVFLETFERVRVASSEDDPVIVLDTADRIRDFNNVAGELFPTLRTDRVIGKPCWSTLPEVAAVLDSDRSVLENRSTATPAISR